MSRNREKHPIARGALFGAAPDRMRVEMSGDQDSTLYFLNQFTSSPQACLACASR